VTTDEVPRTAQASGFQTSGNSKRPSVGNQGTLENSGTPSRNDPGRESTSAPREPCVFFKMTLGEGSDRSVGSPDHGDRDFGWYPWCRL
jgi:hypothetical protein